MVKIYKIIYTGGAAEEKNGDDSLKFKQIQKMTECRKSGNSKGYYLASKGEDDNPIRYLIEYGGEIRNSHDSLKDFLIHPYSIIQVTRIKEVNEKEVKERPIYDCPNINFQYDENVIENVIEITININITDVYRNLIKKILVEEGYTENTIANDLDFHIKALNTNLNNQTFSDKYESYIKEEDKITINDLKEEIKYKMWPSYNSMMYFGGAVPEHKYNVKIEKYLFDSSGSEIEYIFGKKEKRKEISAKLSIYNEIYSNELKVNDFKKILGEEISIRNIEESLNLPGFLLDVSIDHFPPFFALQENHIIELQILLDKIKNKIAEDYSSPKDSIIFEFKIPTFKKFGKFRFQARFNDLFRMRRIQQYDYKNRSINAEFYLHLLEKNNKFGIYFLLSYMQEDLEYIKNNFGSYQSILMDSINSQNTKFEDLYCILKNHELMYNERRSKIENKRNSISLEDKLQFLGYDLTNINENVKCFYVLFDGFFKKASLKELKNVINEDINIVDIEDKNEIELDENNFEIIFQITWNNNFLIAIKSNDGKYKYYNACYHFNIGKRNLSHLEDSLNNSETLGKSIYIPLEFFKSKEYSHGKSLFLLSNELNNKKVKEIIEFLCIHNFTNRYYTKGTIKNITNFNINSELPIKNSIKNNYTACHYIILSLSIGLSIDYKKMLKQEYKYFFKIFEDPITKYLSICILPKEFYENKDSSTYKRIVCWLIHRDFRKYFTDEPVKIDLLHKTYLPKILCKENKLNINNVDIEVNESELNRLIKYDSLFKYYFNCLYNTVKDNDLLDSSKEYVKANKIFASEYSGYVYKDVPKDPSNILYQKFKYEDENGNEKNVDISIPPDFIDLKLKFIEFYNQVYSHYCKSKYIISADIHNGISKSEETRSVHLNIYLMNDERIYLNKPLIYSYKDDFEKRLFIRKTEIDFKILYSLLLANSDYDKTVIDCIDYLPISFYDLFD